MTVAELLRKLKNYDRNLQVQFRDDVTGQVFTQIDAVWELRRDAIEDMRKASQGEELERGLGVEIVANLI